MPLDPSIPLSVKPVQPFNGLAQLGEIRAQQQEAQLRQQQIASNQAAEQSRRQQLAAAERGVAETHQLDQLMSSAFVQDPESGISTFDRPTFEQGLVKGGLGHLYPTLSEHLDKLDASAKKRQAEGRTMLAQGIVAISDAGNTPESLVSTGAYLLKNGVITPEHLQPILDAAKADPSPANIGALLTKIGSAIPEYQALVTAREKGKADLAKTQAETGQITANTVRTQAETAGTLPMTAAQAAAQASTLAGQKETARHNRATEATAAANASANDAVVELSPEALALTAKQFAMTGVLPPMGMGKPAAQARTKIINAAAQQYAGLDLPTQVAAYKANRDSLVKLQGQRDAMGAFEETALKNLDTFLTTAGKVVDTGSPLVNKSLRSLSGALMGSPEMTAYNTARRTVIPEFAKILANPGLSGQLSDSARKEIEEVVSGDATLAQTYAAAKVLKTDAANRRTSYDDQIKAIQDRIARPPGATSTTTPAATTAAPAAPKKIGRFEIQVGE